MWNFSGTKQAAPRGWATGTITNKVFERKFLGCVGTFHDWLKHELNFGDSTILDFGCGDGVMALGINLQLQPRRVIGVEITPDFQVLREMARSQVGIETLPENLEFHLVEPDAKLSERFQADCIFTWSVFEHVSQDCLDAVVCDFRNVLRDRGYVFLQVAPLYYSADGGHLFELSPEPWAHLTMQMNRLKHQVLTANRSNATGQLINAHDGPQFQNYKESVWSCFQTLNRITADGIVDLFTRHGFRALRQYRTCCEPEPSKSLQRIYNRDVLKTEQIVVLFQKI